LRGSGQGRIDVEQHLLVADAQDREAKGVQDFGALMVARGTR
jgi:hypothetical protein